MVPQRTFHGTPGDGGKGVGGQDGIGQVALYRQQKSKNHNVIVVIDRKAVLMQKLIHKVMVLLGKAALFFGQGAIKRRRILIQ